MSKVNRFSLEERYDYQNRKVIYDRDADSDIELNNIYPIIDLLNKSDQKIAELQKQLEEKDEEIKGLNKKLDNLWSIYSLLGVEAFGNDIQEQALKEIVKLQRKNDVKKLKKQLKTNTKQSQKQLAIEELKKIYNLFEPYENSQKDTILCANNGISFIDYLEKQIKSLKGEK